MNSSRRRIVLGALGTGVLMVTGCAMRPMRPVRSDGSYCIDTGKPWRRTSTCTPSQIPSEQEDAVAKRFEATPDMLTVYVIRQRWGDVRDVVSVQVDTGPAVATVPDSFVRLRMAPGSHQLVTALADAGSTSIDINGHAGEMMFLDLVGSFWVWDDTYYLRGADPGPSRSRVNGLRLVADVSF